jgi:hypothetical protein
MHNKEGAWLENLIAKCNWLKSNLPSATRSPALIHKLVLSWGQNCLPLSYTHGKSLEWKFAELLHSKKALQHTHTQQMEVELVRTYY